MSAYSVSSLSPSHSRQVLSAPCSPLVVVFPALGLGSGSLGTWVDCIIQVPFFRSNANQQNIHSGILSSSPASSCSIAGHVIPETSGQGFCEAVLRDADCHPYLAVPGTVSVIADRLSRLTCRQGQLGCPLAAPAAITGLVLRTRRRSLTGRQGYPSPF